VIHVETVTTLERLHEIELEWDALYKCDPSAHFYLSSAFMIAVAQRAEGKFRILVAWSEDQCCVGILPLVVTLRWNKDQTGLYNVIDMLGHVFDADYTGIVCDPQFEAKVCQAFANKVSQMPFGRLILNYVHAPAARLETFTAAFDDTVFDTKANTHFINDGQTNNLICPYIDLPETFDDYLSSLSANARQKLRRLMRQLHSDPSLKITRSRPETYPQDVAALAKLWYAKHVAQKGEKRAKQLADLFQEVVMLGLASGTVYLATLWRDGRPIAAQANYIDLVKRHALFHVAGRDETVRDLSAGLMLQAHCIRWAIANGLTRYDFTIGDEPYKYSLGAVDRAVHSAEVFTKAGMNWCEPLHESCREDVYKIIRQFSRNGRTDDARAAARQALITWPEPHGETDPDRLIAKLRADFAKARKNS